MPIMPTSSSSSSSQQFEPVREPSASPVDDSNKRVTQSAIESLESLSSIQTKGCSNRSITEVSTLNDHKDAIDIFIAELKECGWKGNVEKLKSMIKTGCLGFNNQINLTRLPESIGLLVTLERLDLSGTGLTDLPETIGNLKNLKFLSVNTTEISSLPQTIGNLVELDTLDLSNTVLASLPKSIGSLIKLERLLLSGSLIESLPVEIGCLSNLKTLYLNDTKLTSLPDTIGDLIELQELHVWGAKLTSLPISINNLAKLRSLHLPYTQITSLPREIQNLLERLINLNLSGCPIIAEGDDKNLGLRELRAIFSKAVINGQVYNRPIQAAFTRY